MFAIPIIVDGEFIGGFVGGQVRCNDAPADTVHLKNVMPYKADFLEDDEVREIYMQADLIPYKKYVSMAFLMESYFRQLAEKRSAGRSGYRVRSLEKKIAFVPGGSFYPNGNKENTLRINYSNMPEDKIEKGLKTLGEVVKEYIRQSE